MPEDTPIVPPTDNEQQRPALFVEGTNAPALPPFDRSAPPEVSDLPRLLTPAQVAVVFGISVEAARNDGNRNRLGEPTQIEGRSHYRAEEVVRRWHERFGTKPAKPLPNGGERQNSLTEQANLVVRAVAAMERMAEGGGGQQEVMLTQARMLEAQQQEIRRLTEALEQERKKANNRPRTWWGRLFGG